MHDFISYWTSKQEEAIHLDPFQSQKTLTDDYVMYKETVENAAGLLLLGSLNFSSVLSL